MMTWALRDNWLASEGVKFVWLTSEGIKPDPWSSLLMIRSWGNAWMKSNSVSSSWRTPRCLKSGTCFIHPWYSTRWKGCCLQRTWFLHPPFSHPAREERLQSGICFLHPFLVNRTCFLHPRCHLTIRKWSPLQMGTCFLHPLCCHPTRLIGI